MRTPAKKPFIEIGYVNSSCPFVPLQALSEGMHLCYLFRRLLIRKARTTDSLAPNVKFSDSTPTSQRCLPEMHPAKNDPHAFQTASNALQFALQTLGSISSSIPFGTALGGIIGPLLEIAGRIEQISDNKEGLEQLAEQIALLTPIVDEMAKKNPSQAQRVVKALQRVLQSITKDLEVASSQGTLSQIFNSANNASSLDKHNATLSWLISVCMLATIHEVSKSVHKLEESSRSKGEIKMADIDISQEGIGGSQYTLKNGMESDNS
ncbi:hypothetical protein MVEN_00970000 [Mycena venus]|uniref:Uncharacterized protein n=1 Tax=Mycena venus TaxID=2733690 RepID=A0A8H6YDK8_9AGAR|nr:hypothetical protein MVEN_00970000 [Mycena venus]